jgi:hypothetical protein
MKQKRKGTGASTAASTAASTGAGGGSTECHGAAAGFDWRAYYMECHGPEKRDTCYFTLDADDFAEGPCVIDTPGVYVLQSDVAFEVFVDPPSSSSSEASSTGDSDQFLAGHMSALQITCDNVVVDLNGHCLRQSLLHYFEQRFFAVVQLGTTMFRRGQGPGLVQRVEGDRFRACANVAIINGTIGLSSHHGIIGNDNDNITLWNLTVRDYEVAGVQLNGVHNATIQDAQFRGIPCVPVSFATFSLIVHKRYATANGLASDPAIGPAAAAVCEVYDTLQSAFGDAQEASHGDIAHDLHAVHDALRELAEANDSADGGDHDDDNRERVGRFVSPNGLPDGSALVGVLLHTSGVAIHEIGKTSGGCCPMRASGDASVRRWSNVFIKDVDVREQRLDSHESFVVVRDDGTIPRDISAAVFDMRHLESGSPFDRLRGYAVQQLTGNEDALVQWLTTTGASAPSSPPQPFHLKCNLDVMAHVAKGLFGVRIEGGQHGFLERVTVADQYNHSRVVTLLDVQDTQPLLQDVSAPLVKFGANLLSQTSSRCFGGADTRGFFVSDACDVYAFDCAAEQVSSSLGLARAFELFRVRKAFVHTFVGRKLSGLFAHVLYLHDSCAKVAAESIACVGIQSATLLERVDQALLMDEEGGGEGDSEGDSEGGGSGEEPASTATCDPRFGMLLSRLVRNTTNCHTVLRECGGGNDGGDGGCPILSRRDPVDVRSLTIA